MQNVDKKISQFCPYLFPLLKNLNPKPKLSHRVVTCVVVENRVDLHFVADIVTPCTTGANYKSDTYGSI